jgi:small acid-soluble spore protein E (minor gamma-type SASP)
MMNNKNFGPQESKTNAQQVRQQNQQSAQRQTGKYGTEFASQAGAAQQQQQQARQGQQAGKFGTEFASETNAQQVRQQNQQSQAKKGQQQQQ